MHNKLLVGYTKVGVLGAVLVGGGGGGGVSPPPPPPQETNDILRAKLNINLFMFIVLRFL
jgi:hypothetical protein